MEEKSTRYRVNVSVSTKGVKTWDCTYEVTNSDLEDVLEGSDKLVKELESRYPIDLDGK